MRKIAIFTSGEGKVAKRLVSLFNEGNRIRVDLVLSDKVPCNTVDDMMAKGVNAVCLPRAIWDNNPEEIVKLTEESGASLIVLDDFTGGLPAAIAERYEGRIVVPSSADDAPREVVSALGKSGVENAPEPADDGDESASVQEQPARQKSVDEEWAETLKINFDSARVRPLPPPVPPLSGEHGQSRQPRQPQPGQQHYQQTSQGQPGQVFNRTMPQANEEPMPSTYLIWSILCTVFCCFVPGIVAIIFSSQVSSRYFTGDVEGARKASRNAEIWIIVSFVLGVLSATLYLPIMIFTS